MTFHPLFDAWIEVSHVAVDASLALCSTSCLRLSYYIWLVFAAQISLCFTAQISAISAHTVGCIHHQRTAMARRQSFLEAGGVFAKLHFHGL